MLFCGYVQSMEGKMVSEFSINYQHEARLGTKFDIFCSSENDEYYFKTVLENGETGAEARLTLKNI